VSLYQKTQGHPSVCPDVPTHPHTFTRSIYWCRDGMWVGVCPRILTVEIRGAIRRSSCLICEQHVEHSSQNATSTTPVYRSNHVSVGLAFLAGDKDADKTVEQAMHSAAAIIPVPMPGYSATSSGFFQLWCANSHLPTSFCCRERKSFRS
jgi:hypothetical protein